MMAAKKTRKKRSGTRAPTKTKAQAGRRDGPNKSAFIREQPRTMSAKEVVGKAAEYGLKITDRFVYTARSNARKVEAKHGPDRTRTPATTSEEAVFRGLVVALGTNRARELIAQVETKLEAVIAGR